MSNSDKINTQNVPASELTDELPRDSRFDGVRETIGQLKVVGRTFLRGQVRLGMQLAALRKEHLAQGGGKGGDRKSTGRVCPLIPWDKLVEQETGYSRRSCDVFIALFEATKLKLKTSKKLDLPAPAKKDALVLFQTENPLALNDEQWQRVDEVIGSLTTGETQGSLMAELGLIAKPKAMPKGGKQADTEDDAEQATAGQLAFHFFEGLGSSLINTRSNPDYRKLLMALPVDTTEENQLSLSALEAEARALLADIEDAKLANAKPAKGRTLIR